MTEPVAEPEPAEPEPAEQTEVPDVPDVTEITEPEPSEIDPENLLNIEEPETEPAETEAPVSHGGWVFGP